MPYPDTDPSRPQPTAWADYVAAAKTEWQAVLASGSGEKAVHRFLEQNPSFLPGPNEYGAGHHGPHDGVLFSEVELKGIGQDRRPDFMWITATSDKVRPVFIEIEDPAKALYTAKGVPTAEYQQAHNQLIEWKRWWSEGHGHNQAWFTKHYLEPIWNFHNRTVKPIYILIYGRSSEFQADPTGALTNHRAQLAGTDEELMSFDRLEPKESLADVATVYKHKDGRMTLRAIPASYTTGPETAVLAAKVRPPKASVFREVTAWSPERQDYVHRRWNHWASYGREQDKRNFMRSPQRGE